MRSFFVLILSIICCYTNGQLKNIKQTKSPLLENVKAFLEDHENTDKADKCFLSKPFKVILSDSSVTIKEFLFSWQNVWDCYPWEFLVKGNTVIPDQSENRKRLTDLKANNIVLIEEIKVIKNGRLYKIKPVAYLVTDIMSKSIL